MWIENNSYTQITFRILGGEKKETFSVPQIKDIEEC